jgi:hypothetical protein
MRLTGADNPTVCTVCLQPPMAFDPRPEFVDFESAYDGPVIDDPNAEGAHVYLDKIIICEHCVKQAARLLGLDNVERHVAEKEALVERTVELEHEIADKDKAISHLTHTVGTLIDHPVKRPAGKPQIVGPESHEDELKSVRASRARGSKVSKGKKKAAASGANGK